MSAFRDRHEAALKRAIEAQDFEAAELIKRRMSAGPAASESDYSALRKARAAGDDEAASVIEARIQRSTREARSEDSTADMSGPQRFAAGVGAGMLNTAKNIGDIAGRVPGLSALRPNATEWEADRQATGELTDTGAGAVGNFAGEMVATLPIGGVAGGLTKAVGGKLLTKAAPKLAQALASRAGVSTAEGLAQGYVMAGPESRGLGAVLGGVGGGALTKGGQFVAKTATGSLRPAMSEAAKYLRNKGVDKLTVGQLAPRSALAQGEQAGQSVALIGPLLKAQRQAGNESWQDAVLREALAPDAPMPAGGAVPERLDAIYRGFNDAYRPVREAQVEAVHGGKTLRELMGQAFDNITEDPTVLATQADRDAARRYLANQATMLDRVAIQPVQDGAAEAVQSGAKALPPGGELAQVAESALARQLPQAPVEAAAPMLRGTIPAEPVMAIRSNLRKKLKEALSGGSPNYDRAELLGNAEKATTHLLGKSLPKKDMARLRKTDAAYRKYMLAQDAVRRAGDTPDGFSPVHLSAAVRKANEGASYARGAGGEMRKLASAGQEVLNTTTPPTGARILSAFLAPAAVVANTPAVKRALFGDYLPQRAAQMTAQELERLGLIEALRRTAVNRTAESVAGGEP